jgi:hypothetical protein
VSAETLGRVVDPEALAAEGGPRGLVRIELPAAWLVEPCAIDLTVPPRLVCARCDGGGCDGCERSGAVRAPSDRATRTVRVTLPRDAHRVAVRIAEPFGPRGGIAQLILEVREGRAPSPGVIRCGRALAPPLLGGAGPRFRGLLGHGVDLRFSGPRGALAWSGMALVALAMVAAILIALFAR